MQDCLKFCQRTIVLLSIISSLHFSKAQITDVRMPPSIVDDPPIDYLYLARSNVPLPCLAVGSAELSYIWRKNGNVIECNSDGRYLCVGPKIISISNASATDEGYYQCFVSNAYGSTMSNVMRLRMEALDPGSQQVTSINRPATQGLMITCNAPRSVPSLEEKAENATAKDPLIEWGTATGPNDNNPAALPTSQRIQIHSRTGDLYFSNFEGPGTVFYKCMTRTSLGTSYSGFTNLTIEGAATNFPVSNLITAMVPSIGLEEQSVIFQCLFEGRPTPTLTTASWRKVGGNLPIGRYSFPEFSFNTKLMISNLQPSDAGDYTCQPDGQPDAIQTMTLTVQALPVFVNIEDRPYNMNVSEQDTITINCSAYAIPAASVIWYKNGQELNPNALPVKFQLSPDHTQLTISDLCKVCDPSDLMTLQCNASNTHGYSFVQGYVNVLQRTLISSPSVDVPAAQQMFVFECSATTDDSTPLSITWYLDGLPVMFNSIRYVDENNALNIDLRNSTDQGFVEYCHVYTCLASNGVSSDTIEANLNCGAVIVQSSSSQWWIILIVILVILLLILLLLLLYCKLKDSDGDIYLVDEKERENGNDPIQEIRDEDFTDYKRDAAETSYGYNAMNSAATTLEAQKTYGGTSYNQPTGLGLTTFGQPAEPLPAYEPFEFNSQQRQLQRNATAVLYSRENGGQINLGSHEDMNDGRSYVSDTANRPGSRPFTPLAYATQADEIRLIENGVPYGIPQLNQANASIRDSGSRWVENMGNQQVEQQFFDVDINNHDADRSFESQQQEQYQPRQQRQEFNSQQQQYPPQQFQRQYSDQLDNGFQHGMGYEQNRNLESDYAKQQPLPYGYVPNDNNALHNQRERNGSHVSDHQGQVGEYNINNQRIGNEYDDDDYVYRREVPAIPTGWAALNMHDNPTSDV